MLQTPEERLEPLFREMIEQLDTDPLRAGLHDTPRRAARAMRFLTEGYRKDIGKEINGALFPAETDQLVLVKDIEFYSLCEHHLLPFIGRCHVAYQPDRVIIGLSKIPRIVDIFARRFQVQENLTQQIAHCVAERTGAKGVGVMIEARHLCMMMRGVEKQSALMRTCCLTGSLKGDPGLRSEFHEMLRRRD